MAKLQSKLLRKQARSLLQTIPYRPKKLVLIHTGVSLGASLLLSILSYVLNLGIGQTGGLSGIGLRSVLASAQAVLELGVSLVLPFWNVGLLFAALRWANGENATPTHLLQGFRRFPALLGLSFVQGGLYLVLGMAVFYISSSLFLLTPYSDALMAQLAPLMEEGSADLLAAELMEAAGTSAIPLLALAAVLFAVVAIPMFYRLRFAPYAIMEGHGTVRSMVHSVRITKGSVLQLIKLDLSFWWFYLLQALTVALCYGDQILPALGITLPLSADLGFFLFYVLGIVTQLLLLWQCQARVSTAYCLAYRMLESQQF